MTGHAFLFKDLELRYIPILIHLNRLAVKAILKKATSEWELNSYI